MTPMREDTLTLRRPRVGVAGLVAWAALALLGVWIGVFLWFFLIHASHLLAYPYPLDYGEGPLLAQVRLLRDGLPLWQLYADPAAAPANVVNYPPLYHLLAALLALPLGDPLLAGRLLALLSTLASVAALVLLASGHSAGAARPTAWRRTLLVLLALSFLGLPIVREWAVLMRVDMLGLALGLSGLLLVQRRAGRAGVLWATPLLLASLYVKPSLLAAPAAACLWLLFRDWRRALWLGGLLLLSGGLLFGALQLASGGWFRLHIITANANPWQHPLARGFWHDQLAIHWPLLVAAGLSLLLGALARPRTAMALPLLALQYTLFGALTALGVGKVGAYANYFLEFYAGLVWLCASVAAYGGAPVQQRPAIQRISALLRGAGPWLVAGLVCASMLRYYPTWSPNYLKLAGIIEGQNPARLAFGRYSIRADLRREQHILATLARANAALVAKVAAAGAPIVTDIPGVATQAGQTARLQAFEHRQLLDVGSWDQRPLLRDLANGQVPLVVLDYLGNWLTPQLIATINHRYAQDGSRGTYDLYRPVAPGPRQPADLRFPNQLQLTGFYRTPASAGPAYGGGELVTLTLEWQRTGTLAEGTPDVVLQLTDQAGRVLLEQALPLLYGALAPQDWPLGLPIQHMQSLRLPPELPPGTYTLSLMLREHGHTLAPPQPLTPIDLAAQQGLPLGASGHYVPEPLLAFWRAAGAERGLGDPLSPAVPFADGVGQCFQRGCLRLSGGLVTRLPLGELVQLADIEATLAPPADQLAAELQPFWQAAGGAAQLGPPVSGPFVRGGRLVQYTRYARLERPLDGGPVEQAPLGAEFLRLPGGTPYRWPAP